MRTSKRSPRQNSSAKTAKDHAQSPGKEEADWAAFIAKKLSPTEKN